MLFEKTSNWKKFLSADDEKVLNEFLEKVSNYRPAYKNADDVKIAQLWTALLETRKENSNLNARLKRIESILDTISQKDQKEKEELMQSLRNL